MAVGPQSNWTAYKALTVVKLVALSIVLLAMAYDFLAHASNLLGVASPFGFDFTYGSPRYELVASLYWGFALLFSMVAVVAHSTQRALAAQTDEFDRL